MRGVKGWYSANQRTPAGIESVGDEPTAQEGQEQQRIGRLLAVSTLLLTMPRATVLRAARRLCRIEEGGAAAGELAARGRRRCPAWPARSLALRASFAHYGGRGGGRLTALWDA